MDDSHKTPGRLGTLSLQPTAMPEKKPNLWFSGVFSCMSSMLSVLGKDDWLDDYEDSFTIKPERIVELKLLGEGAQGKVHLATMKQNNGNEQKVAVKYVKEIDNITARHLRRINHENIVQTIGVCMEAPKYFIVMEYCENGSLFDYMRSGVQFSPLQLVHFAKNIAKGMNHLHEKKIVHRDLKSPNVLITRSLVAKVSDFGTSRTLDGASAKMTFAGTVNWMAPEVIRAGYYSEKVDVWSFGVVLWELVTLQVPYYKMEQHTIMWGVGTDSVSLPIPMGVPNSIHVLLVQCWNRKYAQRPSFAMIVQSLELISEELQNYDVRTFMDRQAAWAREARDSLEKAFLMKSVELSRKKIPTYTDLCTMYSRRDLKDKRHALNLRLDMTNDLFFEMCSVRLALEMRERELAEKERMVDFCRCGARRPIKLRQDSSSSSDALSRIGYRAHLKKPIGSLYVELVKDKAITKLADCECKDKINRNASIMENKKETVVEINGNVNMKKAKKVKAKTDSAVEV